MLLRRLLLISLVLICLLAILAGCTTADVACDMRANYENETPPWMEGTVKVKWQYNAADLPPNVNGNADCFGPIDDRFCILKIKGPPASFNNICGLAKETHELHHGEGARHER